LPTLDLNEQMENYRKYSYSDLPPTTCALDPDLHKPQRHSADDQHADVGHKSCEREADKCYDLAIKELPPGNAEVVPYVSAKKAWATYNRRVHETEPEIDDKEERLLRLRNTWNQEDGELTESCGVRLHVGVLDFKGLAYGAGGGIFEQVTFRVSVSTGTPSPKWIDGPSTSPQAARFRRVVSDSGRYSTVVSCDFDEFIDLPWPGEYIGEEPFPPEFVVADVWLEKVTMFDTVEKFLGQLGLGDGPKLEHVWIGRATTEIPPWGEDILLRPVLVAANPEPNYPEPNSVTIGIEWVEAPNKY